MTTVTVLSGPERRRRWSSSEKARIVEASYEPGAAVTDVARRHDVHPNLLHHWRRQAKRASEVGGGLKLLPVRVTAPGDGASAGSIEIELGGAVRVRVDAAVDEAALGRVLRALGR
jgi:transposase